MDTRNCLDSIRIKSWKLWNRETKKMELLKDRMNLGLKGEATFNKRNKGKAFRIQIQYENVFEVGKLSKSLKEKKFVGCFGSSEWSFIIDPSMGFFNSWRGQEKKNPSTALERASLNT